MEFLINNCSDIFGEEIYSLLFRNTDNSLDMTGTLILHGFEVYI